MIDDSDRLSAIAAGDEEAMHKFFDQYASAVHNYAMSRCADMTLASDIMNLVMMEVWRHAGNFQGRSKVTTWLFSIARHKLIDHYRREQRHTHTELPEQTADSSPTSEQLVSAAQNAKWVRHCIGHLGEIQREIIHLAFYADMAYPEIAEIIECPVGTVKSRMYYARDALRRCLDKLANGDGADAFN